MKSAVAFVAFLFLFPFQVAPALAADTAKFMVSVYADVNTPPQSIPYDRIDGLVLAFINPVDGCRGYSTTEYPAVQAIVRGARAQEMNGHEVTVTFAIGGGGNPSTNQLLESIASSADCRAQFAGQVAAILTQNDLDGVDIDWEFPQTSSLGNYTLFIKTLREAIGTKLLSIAIYDNAGKEDPATHMTSAVFPYVDYYMVMAYLAPRNAAIDSWITPPWNLAESQLRLGLALFGTSANGSTLGYNSILGTVPPAQANPCGDRVGSYGINGLSTTQELTRFSMTEQLGGITGWELGDDRSDSISLMNAANDIARMWTSFAQWQSGTAYPAGTIVQNQGNLWLAKAAVAANQPAPSLANAAFQQFETTSEWSANSYYCGGDEVWYVDTVYHAVQDPPLSTTDLSPTGNTSLWKKLYAAPLYDNAKTYKKGERVFFNGSVYAANKKTKGQSPAQASANWTPFVDVDAYDSGKSYSTGATVRYMGNEYTSVKTGVGANPVVATDVWQPVRK
jgi:hypothetical protein